MRNTLTILPIIVFISLILCAPLVAQEAKSVNWMSFEQLDDSLAVHPKKVFIKFYTDWCTYCHKMDRVVYTKPKVIELLNREYYAVRFDAETEAEIKFGNLTFSNAEVGESRTPVHQIAKLLATRNGQFLAPTMVVLDEKFQVSARYFEYMDSKKLIKAL